MAEVIRNKKYPFVTGEDLKNSGLSDIDVSFEPENMATGLLMSAIKMKEIIGSETYDAIMSHYNSDEYQAEAPTADQALNDILVEFLQRSLAPFGFLETFVWRRLRVSANSVTVVKTDQQDRPFKYDLDEAKNSLFRIGWAFTTELVKTLMENVPTDEGTTPFHAWKASSQYTAMQSLIIRDYKDFNNHYYIDNNAAFFVRTIGIQQKLIENDITPRLTIVWEDVPADGDTPAVSKTTSRIVKLVKDYLAHATMSKACFTMDAYYLPDSLRNLLENEHVSKKGNNTDFVKTKLADHIGFEARKILDNLDMEISKDTEPEEGETYLSNYEDIAQADDKFYFSGL